MSKLKKGFTAELIRRFADTVEDFLDEDEKEPEPVAKTPVFFVDEPIRIRHSCKCQQSDCNAGIACSPLSAVLDKVEEMLDVLEEFDEYAVHMVPDSIKLAGIEQRYDLTLEISHADAHVCQSRVEEFNKISGVRLARSNVRIGDVSTVEITLASDIECPLFLRRIDRVKKEANENAIRQMDQNRSDQIFRINEFLANHFPHDLEDSYGKERSSADTVIALLKDYKEKR